MLEALAQCGATSKPSYLSWNLHRFLSKEKTGLQIHVSRPKITLRVRWPKRRAEAVEYPIVTLSSWAKCLLNEYPHYLLGGCKTLDPNIFCNILRTYWRLHKESDPSHPCFQEFSDEELGFAIHGDEGRGKNKTPTLVIAYQGVISARGMHVTNTKMLLPRTTLGNVLLIENQHLTSAAYFLSR